MRLQGGVKFPTGGRGEQSPEPASTAILASDRGSADQVTRSSPSRASSPSPGATVRVRVEEGEKVVLPGFRPSADSMRIAPFALKRLSQHVNLRGAFHYDHPSQQADRSRLDRLARRDSCRAAR